LYKSCIQQIFVPIFYKENSKLLHFVGWLLWCRVDGWKKRFGTVQLFRKTVRYDSLLIRFWSWSFL